MPKAEETAVIQEEPALINRVSGGSQNVQQLLEVLKKLTDQPGVPSNVKNSAMVVIWMVSVERFRLLEEEFLFQGVFESKIADHRIDLARLIADGESILFAINGKDFIPDLLNHSLDDVQAVLESLHVTFRREHGPRNTEKTNQMIGRLFDASKS